MNLRGACREVAGRRTHIIAMAALTALPAFMALEARANNFNELNRALIYLADTAAPTDPELMSLGQTQFDQGNYEESLVTLQRVKANSLSADMQGNYTSLLTKVQDAVDQRKAARARFEEGQKALGDGNYSQALTHYKAALDNKFADGATVAKAKSQIDVANKAMGINVPAAAAVVEAPKDNKSIYKEAEADFNAGRYDAAREKFAALKDAGFKTGLFERDLDKWLSEIDKAQAKAAAPVVDENAGRNAYVQGKELYEARKYDEAKAQFVIARDAGYKAPIFQASPARFLEMIEDRISATVTVASAEPTISEPTISEPVLVLPAASEPTPAVQENVAEMQLAGTAAAERLRRAVLEEQAAKIMAEASKAEERGQLADALRLYEEALLTDRSNPQAKSKVEDLKLKVTGMTAGSMLDIELSKQKIVKQVIQSQIDKATADFSSGIKDKDFDAASQSLDAVRVLSYSRPELWSATEMRDFQSAIGGMTLTLQVAREEARRVEEQRIAEQTRLSIQEQQTAVELEKRRTIEQLIKTSNELARNMEYEKAQGVVKQILSLDPHNEYANGIERFLNDRVILQRQKILHEQLNLSYEWHITNAEELKVPYRDIINYPSNWPDISDRRDRETALERLPIGGGEASDAKPLPSAGGDFVANPVATHRALDNTIVSVRFEGVALADAIGSLQDMAKGASVNFAPNWKTLQSAGIDKTTAVSDVNLRNVRLKDALDVVLKSVSTPTARAAFRVNNKSGIVFISTADDFNETTIHVYDIQDLLAVAPMSPMPFNSMGQYDYGSAGVVDPYGYGGAYNPYGMTGDPRKRDYVRNTRQPYNMDPYVMAQRTDKMVQDITNTIKEAIDRDSWRENGGRLGSIKFLQGQLVVTQTPDNQRSVTGLLDRLRESKSIQVCVETRFLQIQRNYLEDFGLDLDFFFNINNPQNWSPIAITQETIGNTTGPTTTVPGSIAAKQVNPSLQLSGSFLDDFQVNFLIRATQGANATTTVTAPRVTVFNGQMAQIMVGTNQMYVSDLEAVTGLGVGLYNPLLGNTGSNVTLMVSPIVSADRKYVTLSLSPQITQLVSLENYTVYGVSNDTGGDSEENLIFSGTIQQPITQETQISTMVSVPDGGTLLLGGQTLAAEVEKESGVPILSKIPLVKRLFTNRSTAKDEQVLLILVKPTIIIPREYEERLFPTINSRPLGR